MKKLALALSVFAAMAFVACDNYDLPNPPAQSNPAEIPFKIENLAVNPLPQTQEGVVVLSDYNNEGKLVPVAGYTVTDWPATYYLTMTMNLTAKDKTVEVPCTVANDTIFVSPDDLNNAYRTITKDPNAATVNVNFTPGAGVQEGVTAFQLGGEGYTMGAEQLTFKPLDPAMTLADKYYLTVNGVKHELNHASDLSVYDDPNFSIVLELTAEMAAEEGGIEWTVSDAAGTPFWGGLEDNGTLEADVVGVTWFTGTVMFKFNMETKAYEIFNAFTQLYTPGNANGWNQGASTPIYTNDYTVYKGFIHADGEFKFDATLDWSKNWGVGAEEGLLAEGGQNIKVPQNGCYFAVANIGALTYSVTLIESCGVIGDATPDGWNGQTNLVQSAGNPMVFSAKINFAGTGEWKFRFNDNWDINLGGDVNNLTVDGANMPTPGAGEKTVTIDLSKYPYAVTIQ